MWWKANKKDLEKLQEEFTSFKSKVWKRFRCKHESTKFGIVPDILPLKYIEICCQCGAEIAVYSEREKMEKEINDLSTLLKKKRENGKKR